MEEIRYHKINTFNLYRFDKKIDKCIVCGSKFLRNWCTVRAINIVKCNTCDVRFANPPVSDISLAALYEPGLLRWSSVEEYKKLRREYFLFYKRILEEFNFPFKRVLDFGCGIGYFLKIMNRFGWEGSGVDISLTDVIMAKNSGIEALHLSDIDELKNNYFSVCTMLDFIEHVKDPLFYFETAFRKLASGGILLIDTGDVGGIASLIGKSRNPFVQNEGHITFFTRKSINFILKKSGFNLLKILDERIVKKSYNNTSLHKIKLSSLKEKVSQFLISRPNMIILAIKP